MNSGGGVAAIRAASCRRESCRSFDMFKEAAA